MLIAQADAALYHAKFHGRDRLIIFEPDGTMAHIFPSSLRTGDLNSGKLQTSEPV